jgi:hypothetical protein
MVRKTVEIAPSKSSQPGTEKSQSYLLVATYLPLKSFWKIIPFIRLSSKIEAQLRESNGIVRYALKTDMPRRRFWTLSAWTNREDMTQFSRSEPHRTAMKKFFEWGTDDARIAEWISPDEKIDWAEAERRLETPTFHYKYLDGKRLVHAPGSKEVSPSDEDATKGE